MVQELLLLNFSVSVNLVNLILLAWVHYRVSAVREELKRSEDARQVIEELAGKLLAERLELQEGKDRLDDLAVELEKRLAAHGELDAREAHIKELGKIAKESHSQRKQARR